MAGTSIIEAFRLDFGADSYMTPQVTEIAVAANPTITEQRSLLPRIIKLVVTLVVLGLLVYQVNWQGVLVSLSQIAGWGIVIALLLWAPNQFLQYLRWRLIAQRAGESVSIEDIRASYWLGHTLGFITPGRIGAYGRALFLTQVPLGKAAVLTVVERTYSALTVNGFGLIALGVLPYLGWNVSWVFWSGRVSMLFVLSGFLLICAGIVPGKIVTLLRWTLSRRAWATRMVSSLDAAAQIGTGSALLYLALATLSLIISLFQFVLILDAIGVDIPLLAGMLAVQLNFFLKGNIPLTLGNIGVGEWTALLCLRGLGVADSHAVAASLMLFTLNVALPAGIGLLFIKRLFALPKNWRTKPSGTL